MCFVCTYVRVLGELIAHRERLSRHIQGTNAELNKYKSNIGTLNNQLQSKVRMSYMLTHFVTLFI